MLKDKFYVIIGLLIAAVSISASAQFTGTGGNTASPGWVLNGDHRVGRDDVVSGFSKIYGDLTTQGGKLALYNSQNEDATFESFVFEATTAGLTLSGNLIVSGTLASGAFTPTGNIIPASGSTYDLGAIATRWDEVYSNKVDLGEDGVAKGTLELFGNGATTGPEIIIWNASGEDTTTEWWGFRANDAFEIRDAGTTVLSVASGGNITLTVPLTDANVSDSLTVTGYMQDTDIDTFAELQAWVSDKTLINEEDAASVDSAWMFNDTFSIVGAQGTISVDANAARINMDRTDGGTISYIRSNDVGGSLRLEVDNAARFFDFKSDGDLVAPMDIYAENFRAGTDETTVGTGLFYGDSGTVGGILQVHNAGTLTTFAEHFALQANNTHLRIGANGNESDFQLSYLGDLTLLRGDLVLTAGDIQFGGTIEATSSGAPTIDETGGDADGTWTLTDCNDVRGTIKIEATDGDTGAGLVAKVVFNSAYATAPHVIIGPWDTGSANENYAVIGPHVDGVSTTGFNIRFAVLMPQFDDVGFSYFVIE